MNKLAERFRVGANGFLECIGAEERNAMYERLMTDMNNATSEAWNSGLLNSITPLKLHIERLLNSPLNTILSGVELNIFQSLVGYSNLESHQNDKNDWDID